MEIIISSNSDSSIVTIGGMNFVAPAVLIRHRYQKNSTEAELKHQY